MAARPARACAASEVGARASFAGIYSSFLNVRSPEHVTRAVLGCYASLWTPQALTYRRKMNLTGGEVLCAVVICEMVSSSGANHPYGAGVAFTSGPVSGRRDRVVIDAAPWLARLMSAQVASRPHGLLR